MKRALLVPILVLVFASSSFVLRAQEGRQGGPAPAGPGPRVLSNEEFRSVLRRRRPRNLPSGR